MSTLSKFERQMNLLAALSDATRPIRLAQIREEVPGYAADPEAARRMFERDKKELLALGVPIEMVPGATAEEAGYRVDRDRFELPEIDLDPEELAALHLALQTIQVGVDDGDIARALWRLGGVVDPTTVASDIGAFRAEMREIPTAPALLPLFRAVAERRAVRFEYERSDGGLGARTVEPWRLAFERGRWYLRAFDTERLEPRNFRLDRIRGEVILDDAGSAVMDPESERPEGADPWEYGEGEPIVAELRLDPVASVLAGSALASCPSRTEADGSVVWSVPVTNWPAFRSFVLSFLDRAEILSPPELRDAMVDWLGAIGSIDG